MSDEQRREDQSGGTSRRSALKLGVGAGVGLVAWSGPTITSLGGTPAYAAGCTFAIQFDVTGCRNTAQANCGGDGSTIAYLPFEQSAQDEINALDNYSIDDGMTNSIYCNGSDSPTVTVTFPTGVECEIVVFIRRPNNCSRIYPASDVPVNEFTSGYAEISPLVYQLPTAAQTGTLPASSQYRILLRCQTIGSEGCFN